MGKYYFVLILGLLLIGCVAIKANKPFTVALFENLERLKCDKGQINGYLLQTGYFESAGSSNGIRTFQTFSNVKEVVLVNTYDYETKYYLATNKPDIYKLITQNGSYLDTAIDSRGNTNLKYLWNGDYYYLYIEEPSFGGRIYYITSSCD